jgi:hypothetical protein
MPLCMMGLNVTFSITTPSMMTLRTIDLCVSSCMTTLRIMTLSIVDLNVTINITKLSVTSLSIMTVRITTLSIFNVMLNAVAYYVTKTAASMPQHPA